MANPAHLAGLCWLVLAGCGPSAASYFEYEAAEEGETTTEPRGSVGSGSGGTASVGTGGAPASATTGGVSSAGSTTTGGASSEPEPVVPVGPPRLHVEGAWLKDPSGQNVVLRGVALPCLRHVVLWRRGLTFTMDKVKAMKANVVRLMVNAELWQQDRDGYVKSYLDPAVNYCAQVGLYCIIDWHLVEDYTSEATKRATADFWAYVAPKYRDHEYILYEVYNEPVQPFDWGTWKRTAQPWVDLIRSHAPDTVIIVGSPHWSQYTRFAADDPFNGRNLVYSVHPYPIYKQDSWEYVFGAAASRVPVFATEFGFIRSSAAEGTEYYGTRTGYGEPFRNFLDNQHPNINWIAWVYDYEWMPPMIDRSYNLLGGDDHMGEFIGQWLAEKN
jgi:hypothetical protein